MKKCFQAKGVCTITAHTPLSATLVWQLSHYLFRETCFMNSYPKRFFFKRFTAFFHSRDALYPSPQAHMESRMGFRLRLSRVREYSTRGGTSA